MKMYYVSLKQTLSEPGERGVTSDAKDQSARHWEENTDVGDDTPTLLVGVDQRVVDEKRVVMTHEGCPSKRSTRKSDEIQYLIQYLGDEKKVYVIIFF